MFCPNCGAENKETTVPCHQCGFKLSGVAQSKFKGTIMLNSDESVQKLVDAEKAKRAAAGLPGPPVVEGAAPAPGAVDATTLGGASAAGANVPRPRRKMAGTLLGVAPQMGVNKSALPTLPEGPQRSAATPAPGATASLAATSLGHAPPTPQAPGAPVWPATSTDPSAPTQGMQAFTPGQNLSGTMLGGTQALPAVRQEPPAAVVGGTQPLAPNDAFAATATAVPAHPAPAVAASHTAPLPQPSTGTAPLPRMSETPGTVPLVQVPEAAPPERLPEPAAPSRVPSATEPPVSRGAVPPGLSAGEVFLVIATCGVYGVVRMLRQRKKG